MSNKRKSTENTDNGDISRNGSNISQSSWLYRLAYGSNNLQENDVISYNETQDATPIVCDEPITQAEEIPTLSEKTHHNTIWSWLGYTKQNTPVDLMTNVDSIDTVVSMETTDTPKSAYWRSYFTSNTLKEKTSSPENQHGMNDTTTADQQSHVCSKPNVVLPTYRSQFTEPYHDNPTLLTKAFKIVNSIFSIGSNQSDHYQIDFSSMVDAMKKAEGAGKRFVVVGVHGWFPTKLVRSMLGEPTGTSLKFCQQMSTALKTYFQDEHDLILSEDAIVSIPLNWEGKILERVDRLYDIILTEWKKTIQSADVIFWVTHSQGTPVSAILLRRLIENDIININTQPVCMLAMAGISHGPFPTFKGNLYVKFFEADAARELFEFMDSESPISVEFRKAMSFVLANKVKTVLVASMQDQVVPLYSAIMSSITHPNILRAIYIDGHIYSKDDFLIRLISFALKLLNLGLSDHGFLIHISEVLAGNIYSWDGGHSTVYEELKVFMLPLHYLFETAPFGPCELIKPSTLDGYTTPVKVTDRNKERAIHDVEARLDPFQAKARLNPFHLPWTIRGIWDDPRILGDESLNKELERLHGLFDQWNPSTSRLKEVKFRLEPLRARL